MGERYTPRTGTDRQSIFDVASGSYLTFDEETGEKKDVSGVEMKKIIEARPGLTKALEVLMDPKLDSNKFLDVIDELNNEFGFTEERHGLYNSVDFHLPSGGKLRIKVFQDMDNALSFSGAAF